VTRTTRISRSHAVFGLLLSLALLGSSTSSAQSAPLEKRLRPGPTDQKLTKISHDLCALRQEYETTLNQPDRGKLRPSNRLLTVSRGRVTIDAVASGDTQALWTSFSSMTLPPPWWPRAPTLTLAPIHWRS
jgi:hypothetical protein